jgi:hypothetical protein
LTFCGEGAQASYNHRTNDLPSAVFDHNLTNARGTGVASGLAAMTYTLAVEGLSR